jgi:hypothetical protein
MNSQGIFRVNVMGLTDSGNHHIFPLDNNGNKNGQSSLGLTGFTY